MSKIIFNTLETNEKHIQNIYVAAAQFCKMYRVESKEDYRRIQKGMDALAFLLNAGVIVFEKED